MVARWRRTTEMKNYREWRRRDRDDRHFLRARRRSDVSTVKHIVVDGGGNEEVVERFEREKWTEALRECRHYLRSTDT